MISDGQGTRKPPEDLGEVLKSIRRLQHWQVGAVVVLYVVLGLFAFLYVKPQVDQANKALCTFRADLQTRVTQTQDYLRDHPEGFPGVPAAALQQSLAGQIRTVASLGNLACPSVAPVTPES